MKPHTKLKIKFVPNTDNRECAEICIVHPSGAYIGSYNCKQCPNNNGVNSGHVLCSHSYYFKNKYKAGKK